MSKIPETTSDPSLGFSERHWAAEPDIPALAEARKLKSTSPKSAIRSFELLAEKGSIFSLIHLGQIYSQGLGVKADAKIAEQYYTEADQKGSIYGSYYLSLLYIRQKNMIRARIFLEKCVEQGFAPALHKLGRIYYNGWGVKRDVKRAMKLWKQGVSMGNILSNVSLGLAYVRFRGGPSKFITGFELIISSIRRYSQVLQADPGSDLLK